MSEPIKTSEQLELAIGEACKSPTMSRKDLIEYIIKLYAVELDKANDYIAQQRKAHEDTITAAKHERQIAAETIRQIRASGNTEEIIRSQANSWCWIVTDLIVDHGLDHTETGEVALEQVRNFMRRKLSKE